MDWLEYKIRASSIKDFMDCGLRAEAKHLLKIRMPSSGISHLGTALHAGTALYDQGVIDGKPYTADDAATKFVETLHLDNNPDEPDDLGVEWTDGEDIKAAEKVGVKAIVNYVSDIGSQRVYHAVEARLENFPVALDEQKVIIRLTGTTDRIRSTHGGHGISDVKSGAARCTKDHRVSTKAEKAQLAVYELIAEKATGTPITAAAEIIGMSTAHGAVGTVTVPGTRAALVGTNQHPGVLDYLARMLRSGSFAPNPASMLCGKKFCPIHDKCAYRD